MDEFLSPDALYCTSSGASLEKNALMLPCAKKLPYHISLLPRSGDNSHEPVPFYNPKPVENDEEVTPLDTHIALHSSVRRDEIRGLIEHIHLQQEFMQREEVSANEENEPVPGSEPKESGPQPRAVMVSARAGAGKAQFIDALLDHHEVKSRATILIANKCYHNTPFYCWVPIISRIVKTSKDVIK